MSVPNGLPVSRQYYCNAPNLPSGPIPGRSASMTLLSPLERSVGYPTVPAAGNTLPQQPPDEDLQLFRQLVTSVNSKCNAKWQQVYGDQITVLARERDGYRTEVTRLNQLYAQRQSEHEDAQRLSTAEIAKLWSELETIKNQVLELEVVNGGLHSENEHLEGEKKDSEATLIREIAYFQQKLQQCKTDIAEAEAENSDLQTDLTIDRSENARLQEEKDAAEEALNKAKATQQQLQETLGAVRLEAKGAIDGFNAEKETMKANVTKLQAEVRRLKQEETSLQRRLEKLKQDDVLKAKELDALRADLESLKEQRSTAEAEVTSLLKENEDAKTLLSANVYDRADLQSQLLNMRRQLDEETLAKSSLQQELEGKQCRLDRMFSFMDELKMSEADDGLAPSRDQAWTDLAGEGEPYVVDASQASAAE